MGPWLTYAVRLTQVDTRFLSDVRSYHFLSQSGSDIWRHPILDESHTYEWCLTSADLWFDEILFRRVAAVSLVEIPYGFVKERKKILIIGSIQDLSLSEDRQV